MIEDRKGGILIWIFLTQKSGDDIYAGLNVFAEAQRKYFNHFCWEIPNVVFATLALTGWRGKTQDNFFFYPIFKRLKGTILI